MSHKVLSHEMCTQQITLTVEQTIALLFMHHHSEKLPALYVHIVSYTYVAIIIIIAVKQINT